MADNSVLVKAGAKPVFLLESSLFDTRAPMPRDQWLLDSEVYMAIAEVVSTGAIRGLQRIKGVWRVYVDTQEERVDLLTKGIDLRGKVSGF